MNSSVRVAVTGMGSVTPLGVGVDAFWTGLTAGKSAIAETPNETWRQWAPVIAMCTGFDPTDYLPRKQVLNTDRFTQFALVAAAEAIAQAGLADASGEAGATECLHGISGDDVGIAFGSAFGGVQSLEAGAIRLATQGTTRVGARLVSKSIPNAAPAAIAMKYGIRGPVMTYATACASAANAIGEATMWIRSGLADVVVAGGSETLFTPSILAGLRDAGALSTSGPEDKSTWSRPFDANRNGMVMGEGAAVMVLERLDHARARGANVYAELIGYGASNDAYHETAPHPEGSGALLAMQRALKSAGLAPEDVDYVNAHATSTPAGDRAESVALRNLFGERLDRVAVSSIKGSVGHMLGAAGAVEAVTSIQAIRTGILPPTLNVDDPEEGAPPDLVPHHAREAKVQVVLSNSFGFGGQNGSLLFASPDYHRNIDKGV